MKLSVFDLNWDRGNFTKCQKHGISLDEIKRFFECDVMTIPDVMHSEYEERYIAFGKHPDREKYMTVMFTFREISGHRFLRPISARFMRAKEVEKYEKEITKI